VDSFQAVSRSIYTCWVPDSWDMNHDSGQQWTELKSDKCLEHTHVPILCLDRGAEGESRTPTGVMPNGV
jgi:hypothetical protein